LGELVPTGTQNELEQIVEQLEKQSPPVSPESLEAVGKAIAAIFSLRIDEVAILEIPEEGRLLRFILPEKLREVGTIPLSSSNALAARTARSRRAEVVNNFQTFPHASVFEGVPMGRSPEETIQKIVSAPILVENRAIGVVQLCRKGVSLLDAGPDFAARDLTELKSISGLLSRFLVLIRVSGQAAGAGGANGSAQPAGK
jgi:hypothetical protein